MDDSVSLRSEQLETGGLDSSSLDCEQLSSSVTRSCSSEVGSSVLDLLCHWLTEFIPLYLSQA